MVTPSIKTLCEQAKFYYYDILFRGGDCIIPEFITNHFKQCQNCQKQIYQLKRVLSQTDSIEGFEQVKSASKISTILKLQFAYIGKHVNCEIARPFLPGLLDPALTTRIPTPITVHLDHCQQCVNDLETIQKLDLSRVQLFRLSQLFSSKSAQNKISCEQAQNSTMAFVFMTFKEIDEQVLKHLCACPECRKALYHYREEIIAELLIEKNEKKCSLFDQIPGNEKFDYIVPYGLDPSNDKTMKFQRSHTLHLRRCPICLKKIQELHQKIYGIAERPESGVVTVYNIAKTTQSQSAHKFNELYAGYPINVELAGHRENVLIEKSDSIINFTAALKQKILTTNIKSVVKTGFVAAILLVIFTLSLSTPSAKAITLAQIFSTVKNLTNVHISTFMSGKTEPIQERWVSHPLNFNIYKTSEELVLWDLVNKVISAKNLDSDSINTISLTNSQIADYETKIQSTMELTPFQNIKDVPPSAEWKPITNSSQQNNIGITEEYELKWVGESYNGSPVSYKWKVFINPKTEQPVRTEFFRKLSTEDEYVKSTILTIEYLSNTEISAIRDSFF
jgi:hypothetical protein